MTPDQVVPAEAVPVGDDADNGEVLATNGDLSDANVEPATTNGGNGAGEGVPVAGAAPVAGAVAAAGAVAVGAEAARDASGSAASKSASSGAKAQTGARRAPPRPRKKAPRRR